LRWIVVPTMWGRSRRVEWALGSRGSGCRGSHLVASLCVGLGSQRCQGRRHCGVLGQAPARRPSCRRRRRGKRGVWAVEALEASRRGGGFVFEGPWRQAPPEMVRCCAVMARVAGGVQFEEWRPELLRQPSLW
jgi:hypothetical protein